jgi:FOG: CBS domain
MLVENLMSPGVVTVSPDTPLKEVAEMLSRYGISGVPLCDDRRRVLGMVSEGDSLQKERGEVSLGGRVDTRSEAGMIAAHIARIPGVVAVDSQLTWQVDDHARRTSASADRPPTRI